MRSSANVAQSGQAGGLMNGAGTSTSANTGRTSLDTVGVAVRFRTVSGAEAGHLNGLTSGVQVGGDGEQVSGGSVHWGSFELKLL